LLNQKSTETEEQKEQIATIQDFYEKGILSKEEFENKKTQILNSR
jgi:hypothetical protein